MNGPSAAPPVLLTPGPVTTSARTKRAMLRDLSPNEPDLLELTAEIRRRVVRLANGEGEWACVPLQGTGNAANEATLGSLVPRDGKLLVVDNGFYGERLVEIVRAIGLDVVRLGLPVTAPARGADVVRALAAARDISHVVVCHVDTGTGLQNPIEEIAAAARASGVAVIVDAIASFGGLPLDVRALMPRRWWSRPTSGWKACRAPGS